MITFLARSLRNTKITYKVDFRPNFLAKDLNNNSKYRFIILNKTFHIQQFVSDDICILYSVAQPNPDSHSKVS